MLILSLVIALGAPLLFGEVTRRRSSPVNRRPPAITPLVGPTFTFL
jgi:hypothetical protein